MWPRDSSIVLLEKKVSGDIFQRDLTVQLEVEDAEQDKDM